jgi:hypothetical protein
MNAPTRERFQVSRARDRGAFLGRARRQGFGRPLAHQAAAIARPRGECDAVHVTGGHSLRFWQELDRFDDDSAPGGRASISAARLLPVGERKLPRPLSSPIDVSGHERGASHRRRRNLGAATAREPALGLTAASPTGSSSSSPRRSPCRCHRARCRCENRSCSGWRWRSRPASSDVHFDQSGW